MKLPQIFLPLFALLVFFTEPVVGADFQKGYDAFIKKDYATSLKEWKPLAEQGNSKAQFFLGVMYHHGKGVLQNLKTSVYWFHLAADQSNADAQNYLGVMYEIGVGVPQNYKTALYWYRIAVKQGNASAQRNLGLMYVKRRGVLQDFIKAYMWINIAAANGDKRAKRDKDKMANRMTSGDVSTARKRARECVKKKYQGC